MVTSPELVGVLSAVGRWKSVAASRLIPSTCSTYLYERVFRSPGTHLCLRINADLKASDRAHNILVYKFTSLS